MNKKTLSQVGFLLSLALAFAILVIQATMPSTPAMAQAATPLPTLASNTTLSIVPESTSVKPGDSFNISVVIDTDVPTWGLQFGVSFDPNLVEITGVQESSFYKAWATENGVETMMIPNPNPDNNKGLVPSFAIILLGAPRNQGPVGQGELATLNAKVKPNAKGKVEFRLIQVQISDSGTFGDVTTEVGGVMLQNAIVAIGSDAPIQQPTALPNPGLEFSEAQNSAPQSPPQPEPTIERRVPIAQEDSGNQGVAWEIYLPIAVLFIVGVVAFALTRNRSPKAKPKG